MNDNTVQNLNMACAAGVGLGTYVYSNVRGYSFISKHFWIKADKSPLPQDIFEYRQAVQKAIHSEGFDKFGLKILDCSKPEGMRLLQEYEKKCIDSYNEKLNKAKNGFSKYLIKKIDKAKLQRRINYLYLIKEGRNAFAIQRTINDKKYPTILINMEKFPSAVFHELGHHKNHRKLGNIADSFLYGILRNKKYMQRSLWGILLVSLFTNKKRNKNPNKIHKRSLRLVSRSCLLAVIGRRNNGECKRTNPRQKIFTEATVEIYDKNTYKFIFKLCEIFGNVLCINVFSEYGKRRIYFCNF